jgi:hypothetical protein
LTDYARNEELLHEANKETNIPHKIKRKSDRNGHILRRNCLLKRIIEGVILGRTEVKRRRGRRHKHLMDGLNRMREYWERKEGALDHTLGRTGLERGYGPVVR